MANSYIDYVGNGSLTTFTSPPYLEKAHLIVTVGGNIKALSTDYSVADGSTLVVFNTAPEANIKIRISRNSSQNERLTDYVNASLLTADQMDKDANQLFYMAQEAVDRASETNLAAGTFYSSGSTAPTVATLGTLFYNTTTNALQVYSSLGWVVVNAAESKTVFTSPTSGERIYSTGATLGSNTMVFLNGVKLVEGSSNDYVLSGSQVILAADDPTTAYVLEVINR